MEKDQLLINKFLEFLPDNFMDWIFGQLERNMISNDRTVPIGIYIDYVEKYKLPFQDKNLKLAHSKFYRSLKFLQHFLCVNFFISHQATEFLVLHPEVRNKNPEKFTELSNQLDKLLDNTKNDYHSLRKKIEEFLLKDNEAKANKKYFDANESIFLKPLGIIIKDNLIIKGNKTEKINPTDKTLIYFFYFKALENPEECFSIDDLSKIKEIEMDKGYIKNRITFINQVIPKIINPTIKNLRIRRLIKNERGRGYRLDPKTFHTKLKK